MSPSESATDAVTAFIGAFNQQDHEALAATMHFPHIRLANGRFMPIESAEDFVKGSRRAEPHLREEGWHHTVVDSLKVIHAGNDKVHIALTNSRTGEDGTVYNQFETLWIATLIDGKWGIQFRSSFLVTPPRR